MGLTREVDGRVARRCARHVVAVTTAMLGLGLGAAPAALGADPGLRGQWHLDAVAGSGASTTTPDSSGAGQTGTFAGTPFLVAGRFGSALNSGAANGWMNVSRPAGGAWGLESPQVSFTAWIKQAGFPGALKYVGGKGDFPGCVGSSYALYTGYLPGHTGLTFYVTDAAGVPHLSPQLGTGASVWDGNWHAVTGSYDGTAVRLYVDGAEVGSGTPASGAIKYAGAARDNLTIGSYPDKVAGAPCGNTDWPGAIDEVRVHDRALTPAEIAKLHDPAATTPPDLAPPVTPPLDVTLLPARNLVPPTIQQRRLDNNRAQYSCSNGEWEGLAGDPHFVRWIYSRELGVTGGKPAPDKFVTGASGVILAATSPRRLFYCVVRASTASGGTISASGPTRVVPDFRAGSPIVSDPQYVGDLRIRGIDVLQIVQPMSGAGQYAFEGLPQRDLAFAKLCGGGTPTSLLMPACAADAAKTQQARYGGVLLDADKPTSAVVYLDRKADTLSAHVDSQIQVRLRATAGARLNASLTKTLRAFDLRTSPSDAVTATERGDERFGVRFDIPQAWIAAAANGSFDLEAQVTIVGSANVRQCKTTPISALVNPEASCGINDTFKLTDVFARFMSFSAIIRTIGLVTSGQRLTSLNSPASALKTTQDVLPGGEHFQISPYVAQVTIDPVTATNARNCPAPPGGGETTAEQRARLRDCASANVINAVRAWVASGPATDVNASPTDGFHVLVALHNYQYTAGRTEPGSSFNTSGVNAWGRSANQPYLQINDGSIGRPLTAATHELVHAIGAPHAGKNVGGIVGDLSCGGDTDGQVGEIWPPDSSGRLQGVKFDPRTGERTVDGDDTVPNAAQPLWDLMSYCANGDSDAWVSARTWNRVFAFMINAEDVVPTSFRVPVKRAAQAQAAATGSVPVVPGAGFVVGIVDGSGARITGLEPADPDHRVPAGDAASSLRVRGLGADGRPLAEVGARVTRDTDSGATTFIAPVPAGSAAVELVSDGTVVDRRAKGRPPVVALTAPRRAGTRVRRALAVRYRASDPDGGPLTASVEFSPDGRRGWRTVLRGPATGRAVLPMHLLRTATAARIRVRVSDGFSVADATSKPLRVDGSPPAATIVRPARGEHGQAASPLILMGQGADESGRPLRGRALTWYAGQRRLGTGQRLRVRLPAGRAALRLVVRDARGRRTTARRTVRVEPVALQLQTLRAGAVRARARRVVVTVSTNVPAVLRGGGVSTRVGPRTRRVRLKLPAKPAVGIVRVPLRLVPVSGGQTLRPTLVVLRG